MASAPLNCVWRGKSSKNPWTKPPTPSPSNNCSRNPPRRRRCITSEGQSLSNGPLRVRRSSVGTMVAEKPVPIFEEIPDDDDVDHQHAKKKPGELSWPGHFINFDGNEKGRFTDRHPAGP